MAVEKAAPPPLRLSAVSVEKKMKKHAPADPPPFLPGVRGVIVWALFHAVCLALSVAYVAFYIAYLFIVTCSISHPASCPAGPEPVEMTDDVHMFVVLWCVCVVSEAAAGALALALPRHRLLLAYAALMATAAGHCMSAVGSGLYSMRFVAPGGFTFRDRVRAVAVFVFGVGDLLCFWGLVLRGGEE